MMQEISYGIRFSFPSCEDERDGMLPSVDLFLRSLEEADRLLVGSLGLEMEYRRALKELGETSFYYTVVLKLAWPSQILLGAWPEPSSLREWMESARMDLFGESENGSEAIGRLVDRWDLGAKEQGLSQALLYTPPSEEKLSPLLDDIARAVNALGGRDSVVLE
jgi:hypothetical protein